MAGPTLAASDIQKSAGSTTAALVSSAATTSPSNGDVVVVHVQTWDTGVTMSAPTGGSQTFTPAQVSAPGGFNGYSATYTCTISGSPGTFSITSTPSATSYHSMVVERWGSAVVGTAVLATKTGTGSVATTLTTTAANSRISWAFVDEASRDPAGISYTPSGTTSAGIYDGHTGSNSVQYFQYTGVIASAGSTSLGATNSNGSMTWNATGVEIKAASGGSIVDMSVAFVGTSGLTAALTKQVNLAAGLVGTGTLGAALARTTFLAAPLVGTGSLAAGLTREVQLSAPLVGTSGLAAALTREVVLAAPLTGTSGLTAALARTAILAAAFTGTGTLGAALTREVQAAAAFVGTSGLSVGLTREQLLAAGLTGAGIMSATLGSAVNLSAALTATGSMGDALTREALLAAPLAGNGTLTATMQRDAVLADALTGTSSMSAGLTREVLLSAALVGTSGLTAALRREATLAAPLVATGSMGDTFDRTTFLGAALAGQGVLSATMGNTPFVNLAVDMVASSGLTVGLRREATIQAPFVATAALTVALVREVRLAAGLTAASGMTAAVTREVGLSAPLGGMGVLSTGLTGEGRLAAGLAATGALSATLTAGSQTVDLSANLTATAGMTAVFSLPQVGPTDPIALPVAEQLMACFIAQLQDLEDPPMFTQIRVGQETGPLASNNIDECCAGLAWIRVDQVYPSWDSFPAEDNTWTPCGPLAYAVVLEMGVAFCMPWSDSDQGLDNIDPPSTADWQKAFETQMTHQTIMRRTAASCWHPTQRRAVGAWSSLPVEGGCTGGKLMLTVSVPAPSLDC